VLDTSREYTLLTHHHQLDRWLQLGGHLEDDATVLDGAWARSARGSLEVDGIAPVDDAIFDVDIHPIPARGETPSHFHYDVRFLFIADRGAPIPTSESKAVEWVRLSEVHKLNSDPLGDADGSENSDTIIKDAAMSLMQDIRAFPVPRKSVALWWLGQTGYIFKTHEGTLVSTDPLSYR